MKAGIFLHHAHHGEVVAFAAAVHGWIDNLDAPGGIDDARQYLIKEYGGQRAEDLIAQAGTDVYDQSSSDIKDVAIYVTLCEALARIHVELIP